MAEPHAGHPLVRYLFQGKFWQTINIIRNGRPNMFKREAHVYKIL